MESQKRSRFKTGQRVPETGVYVDQHGVATFHEKHRTFPPCVGRKGECAYRYRHMTGQSRSA